MRLHPKIPGTVALWQLQSDLLDTSGNGLHLSPVAPLTNAPVAAPAYVQITSRAGGVVTTDPCLTNAYLNSGPKLMAPLTPLLQFSGPCTFEMLWLQNYTNTHAYIACANPAGRSGGAAPDKVGSLYTIWTINGYPTITDKFYGGGGGAALTDFGYTQATWCNVNAPSVGDYYTKHMAWTRDAFGVWTAYIQGVNLGHTIPSLGTNPVVGNEQFFIGAIEKENNVSVGEVASLRVLNYARSASDILADALACLGACPAALSYRGVRIRLDNHR